MTIAGSWRIHNNRWTIDRITGEPGVDWRIFDEGELAVELCGNLDTLAEWLHRFRIELDDLVPLAEGDDPWAE